VIEIGIPDSPRSRFRIKMRIDEKLRGLVRADSVVTIGTAGVVGETFVTIRPGSSQGAEVAPLATLPSKEPLELADLVERGSSLLTETDGTLKDADGTLRDLDGMMKEIDPKANKALDEVTTAVANANDLVVGLKQGRGAAGMLLEDPVLAGNIRQIATNAQQATASLNHASGTADAMLSDVQSRQFPKKVDDAMTLIKSSASNVDESTKQLRQTMVDVNKPDEQGADAATNIRESLSNVNVASANMADDTEALKRNFLVRGFFRKRGYYNLTQISPDKYRKDKLFASPANSRAWMSGADIFQAGPDGTDELSSQGKNALNAAMVRFGDSIFDSPIVIEGYRESDNPGEQLERSRSRAILVRQYIQRHFQIDESHLGIVPMKQAAPNGAAHATWDGICIVVVNRRP
jgi:phospholipid/cholesterol/gamma-HCH transport system substrate-binding protein